MIQRTKGISTQSPSKHSTSNIATPDKTDNADEIVPSPVEPPKTNDAPSFSSRQSNETTSNNVTSKKVRHASKAALQAIGKIARFERMKEKSAVPDILDDISIDSEFEVSVYRPPPPSQHSTVGTNNSTIFSDDDTNKSPVVQQIAIPELPKMLTTRVSMDHFVDDDTITEMSGMQSNENPENSFLNIDTNSTKKTILHPEKNNNTSPPCDDEHVHDNRTQKSHKVSGKYASLLNRKKKKKKRIESSKKISNIDDIIKHFKLPKTIQSSIGSEEQRRRDAKMVQTNPRGWLGMTNMVQACTNQLIDVICPGPSRTNLRECLAQKLISENAKAGHRRIKTTEQQFDQLLSALFKVMNASQKGSIPKKISRALLCAGVPRTNTLRKACEQFNSSYISTGTTRMEALVDYEKLIAGEFMDDKKIYSRDKKNDLAVEKAVKFLLQPDNIGTFSWGTTTKYLSKDETIVLPKLQRTTSRTNLWLRYLDYVVGTSKETRVGRTTFFSICNEITYSEEILLGSIDYVQALLLTEPIESLQTVIDKYYTADKHNELSSALTSLSQFLRYTYNNHVHLDDDCCTHGIVYGLGRPDSTYIEANETKHSVTCVECRYPTYVCNRILGGIIDKIDEDDGMSRDAINLIKSCSSKFRIFMGHRMRCTNQNEAINKLKDDMVKKLLESNGTDVCALMIIDFKMKFEPASARETSLEHYGKRGIGWHGVHIMYYKLEDVQDDEGGTSSKKPVQYSVYLDQILDDGNRQDTVCVVSLLDAAMRQVTIDIPAIKSIILQSDNANCYQNTFLVCAIAFLNAWYSPLKLKIVTFIHTETQDGKTVLDAHFARCMRYLDHFMKTWKRNKITRINTPNGLGFALAYNGGMTNVMVQVLKTNRNFVSNIQHIFEPVMVKLKQYFTRVNHVEFISNSDIDLFTVSDEDDVIDFIKDFKFEIGVQAYSNVGLMATFNVDI